MIAAAAAAAASEAFVGLVVVVAAEYAVCFVPASVLISAAEAMIVVPAWQLSWGWRLKTLVSAAVLAMVRHLVGGVALGLDLGNSDLLL